MRFSWLAGLSLATAGLLTAAPAALAAPAPAPSAAHVFVLNDSTSANAVYAYERSTDGTLHQTGRYTTGGTGGVLDGSVVDHTASQGALAFDRTHRVLYAVNPGTNTVAVFAVNGGQLTRTQVLSSGGTFPVSIAFTRDRVFVLNARDGGSIQGFVRTGATLARVGAWHRTLGLDPTATPEFVHTPGQIAVTPDGTRLIVTTKAGSNAVLVYDLLARGGLSAAPVTTTLGTTVPFALEFDRAGRIVLTEAGTSAVGVFRLTPGLQLVPVGSVVTTGQAATCWIATDGTRFWVSNAGSASLTEVSQAPGGAPVAGGNTATDPGTVDAATTSDGANLYVQTGASGTVDEYRIAAGGALVRIGSIVVPDAVGGEGIATS